MVGTVGAMSPSTPAEFPPTIWTGDDYILDLNFFERRRPPETQSIEDYEFASQMRTRADAPSATATFTVTPHPTDNWTVTLSLTASQTAALTPGDYAWDVQVTDPSGEKWTLFGGSTIRVRRDATR